VQALDGGKHLTFEASPSLDDIKVLADPDRASQVLINLFTNVLKYGHADRQIITLTTAAHGAKYGR